MTICEAPSRQPTRPTSRARMVSSESSPAARSGWSRTSAAAARQSELMSASRCWIASRVGLRRKLVAPRGLRWVCTHWSHPAPWGAAAAARPIRTASPTVRSAVQAASRLWRFSSPRLGRGVAVLLSVAASASPSSSGTKSGSSPVAAAAPSPASPAAALLGKIGLPQSGVLKHQSPAAGIASVSTSCAGGR